MTSLISTPSNGQRVDKVSPSRSRMVGDLGVPFLTNLPELELGKGAIVELCGEEGTGKTEMLLHCVRQCITPHTWKGCALNGSQLAALWIDTDFAFSILRLVALLEQSLDSAAAAEPTLDKAAVSAHHQLATKTSASSHRDDESCKISRSGSSHHSVAVQCAAPEQLKSESIFTSDLGKEKTRQDACRNAEQPSAKKQCCYNNFEHAITLNNGQDRGGDQAGSIYHSSASQLAEREEFVTSCLERLHVMRCESSEQLLVTLHTLPQLLNSNNSVALLILDSVAAFHWIDGGGTNSTGSLGTIRREMAAVLRLLATDFQLLILTSKPLLLRSHHDQGKRWRHTEEQGAVVEFMPKSWQRIVDHRFLLTQYGVYFSHQLQPSVLPRSKEGEHKVLTSKFSARRLIDGAVIGPIFPFQISYSGLQFLG